MDSRASDRDAGRPSFAHASEAEFARILDFYAVRWHYEPHTFPILWSLDGSVLESFSPDFWLPDLELYVELTTLKQSLVRKKNRKLRRLRELYPDVRIKLFYGRDFRALMLKYGKVGLVDEMSGATGQAAIGDRIQNLLPIGPDVDPDVDPDVGPNVPLGDRLADTRLPEATLGAPGSLPPALAAEPLPPVIEPVVAGSEGPAPSSGRRRERRRRGGRGSRRPSLPP